MRKKQNENDRTSYESADTLHGSLCKLRMVVIVHQFSSIRIEPATERRWRNLPKALCVHLVSPPRHCLQIIVSSRLSDIIRRRI